MFLMFDEPARWLRSEVSRGFVSELEIATPLEFILKMTTMLLVGEQLRHKRNKRQKVVQITVNCDVTSAFNGW